MVSCLGVGEGEVLRGFSVVVVVGLDVVLVL